MKALLLHRQQPVEEEPLVPGDVAVPTPDDGEILIRVRACGVCHTDLHVVEGDLPARILPIIPGHQAVGIVERTGKDVRLIRVGQRVGVAWLYGTDGTCEYCRSGRENLCAGAKFTGYDVNGGFAEFLIARPEFVHPLSGRLGDAEAAPLLCAGIVGYRAYKLSGVRPGESLGLIGFGASAHLVLQVAKHHGCKVYVFSRSPHHRSMAESMGADWTGPLDRKAPALLHGIVSFAPAGSVVPAALAALRKGGVLALAGITMTPIPETDYGLLYHEKSIRSVANNTREDAREFLAIAEEIPLRTSVEVFPLREGNRVLRMLKESRLNGAGVLMIG